MAVFGESNAAYRLAPFVCGVIAMAAMTLALRAIAAEYSALLGSLFLIFSPEAIAYSATLKQYSGELAVSAVLLLALARYLERPSGRRYGLLAGLTTAALALAYSTAFLVPGLALAVWLKPAPERRRRALMLFALTGAALAAVYVFFVAPNVSPVLRNFWTAPQQRLGPLSTAVVAVLGLHALLPGAQWLLENLWIWVIALPLWTIPGFVLAAQHWRGGRREPMILLAATAMPVALVAGAGGLAQYPVSERTNLFLLPMLIALLMLSLTLIGERWRYVAVPSLALMAVGVGLAAAGNRTGVPADHEDSEAAVRYLQRNSQPGETIYVHASMAESFKLYRRILGWEPVAVLAGDTGWPCCPRLERPLRGASTEQSVRRDLERLFPAGPRNVVWVLHTLRAAHWDYVGLDESTVIRDFLTGHACHESPVPAVRNVAVRRYHCPA